MSKCSLWDINSCCGWKRKEKKKLFLCFSICFVRKQSRWIICWAGAFLLHPAQVQVLLDLPDSQMHSHSAGVWSSTGYYWLTCLNSASWKSHSNFFSILPVYESCVTLFRPEHTSRSSRSQMEVCCLHICCLRNHVGLSSHISHLVSFS